MEIRQAKILKELQMETWLTKNKITRYRAILKLHARDKKLQHSQARKLKSAVSKKLASMVLDIEKDRGIVSFLSEGDKRRMLELLSDYREFYLALNHLQASEIYAAIYQDNSVKRRLLDKLYYKKKEKLKQAIELEIERSTLSIELEEQEEIFPDCVMQRLVMQLQEYIAKHNAARIIHFTYCSMLNILKKDATFFDTLLDILKEDQYLQYKTILKVTIMGQLAAENLDNIKGKCKRMRHIILHNMKIREKMLHTVRCQVKDLWAYAQSLVRVESDTAFAKEDIETYTDKILHDQLMQLENICNRVRDILLVSQHHELLSRFEEQSDHKTALLMRLDTNVKDRDLLLSKKYQAEHVLEVLKYSTRSIAEERKLEKYEMLEQIELEKEREKELKKVIKDRGELIVKIREALHSMSTMLFFIKPAKVVKKAVIKNKEKSIEDIERENILFELQEGEANVLLLLAKVTRKINVLFGMSNFEIEEEDKARDLYQTYVSDYTSNLIFGIEEEPIELLLEPEIIDTAILTRTDIKLRSKEIIEAHLKLE